MKRREDKSPIPQTQMRRFYETLRMLNAADIHQVICEYLSGADARLDRVREMFGSSVKHAEQYRNEEEHFHDRCDPDWHSSYSADRGEFARALVARLKKRGIVSLSCRDDDLGFEIVDYEVSPMRTTGSFFDDGTSGKKSGVGGMDLLLRSTMTNRPIIGEVKAPTDTNIFLALIQALVYAVELSTPAQLSRLQRHYNWPDRLIPGDVRSEIYLFYAQEEEPKLLRETQRLADRLLAAPENGSSTGVHVRDWIARVAFVEAHLGDDESVSVHVGHVAFGE